MSPSYPPRPPGPPPPPPPPTPPIPPPGRPPPGRSPRPDLADPRAYVVRHNAWFLAAVTAMCTGGLLIAAQVFTHSKFEFASLSGVFMVVTAIGTVWLGLWSTWCLVTRRPAVVVDSAGVHTAWGLRRGRFVPWARVTAMGAPVKRITGMDDNGRESVVHVHYIKVLAVPESPGTPGSPGSPGTPGSPGSPGSVARPVRKICPNPDRPRLRAAVHLFAPHVVWQVHDAG